MARNIRISNQSQYPVVLEPQSSGIIGETVGAITDQGSGNSVKEID
ncbi:hypothetical protein ACFL6U_00520 [Planctomycetota bacterium]